MKVYRFQTVVANTHDRYITKTYLNVKSSEYELIWNTS